MCKESVEMYMDWGKIV